MESMTSNAAISLVKFDNDLGGTQYKNIVKYMLNYESIHVHMPDSI